MLQDLGSPATHAIAAGVALALIALAFVVLLLPASGIDEDDPHWMLEWILVKGGWALKGQALQSLLHYPSMVWNFAADHKDQWLSPLLRVLFGWDPMELQPASPAHQRGRDSRAAMSPRPAGFRPFMNEHFNVTGTEDRSKITSRAQLAQLNNEARANMSIFPRPSGHLVHGLVNTGNSCFLNSVLQALSSVELLLPYLEMLLEHSEMLQVAEEEVQVTEALADTLQALQQPMSSHQAFRPRAIVDALSNFRRKATTPGRGHHGNLMNREQQDAQELFQLISSALSTEELYVQRADVTRPALNLAFLKKLVGIDSRRNGLGKQYQGTGSVLPNFWKSLNPLSGLLASRLSCMQCGYTEAIRHFTFDNLSLSLPSAHSCYLEDCLQQYVTLESLHDVVCRKCSLQATLSRIKRDLQRIEGVHQSSSPSHQGRSFSGSLLRRRHRHRRLSRHGSRFSSDDEYDNLSSSSETEEENDADDDDSLEDEDDTDGSETELAQALRQDRLWNTNSNAERLRTTLIEQQQMLEQALRSDIEAPLPDIKLSSVISRHCTKQVMLAKPPPVLCLHFVRSQYSMYGTISKNGCHVRFPEYLNLSPFCTSGVLLTRPNLPISVSEQELERLGLAQASLRQHLDTRAASSTQKKKRKQQQQQQAISENDVRYIYRLQSIVVHYGGHSYGHFIAFRRKPESLRSQAKAGPFGLGLMEAATTSTDSQGWFRISDETVESVSIEQALAANPYMLLYERVVLPDQEPTLQHQQAHSCRTGGPSLLTPSKTWQQSIVQAAGLSKHKMTVGLQSKEQSKISTASRFEHDRMQNESNADGCEKEGLYPAFHHLSQRQRSSRDGDDMSDMESMQSLDGEDASGRHGGWRSFVSSPNSTTPPSPDTGASTSPSPASSSLASPVIRQRTQLAHGLQKQLSVNSRGYHDNDVEEMEDGDEEVVEPVETDGWSGDRFDQWAQQQQVQQLPTQIPEPNALSTLNSSSSSPILSRSRTQPSTPPSSENSTSSTLVSTSEMAAQRPVTIPTPLPSPISTPVLPQAGHKKKAGFKKKPKRKKNVVASV